MNEVVQAMVTRRSCRQYWDRPVPEELLDQVLLAGTYAANGRGRQAGRIVAVLAGSTVIIDDVVFDVFTTKNFEEEDAGGNLVFFLAGDRAGLAPNAAIHLNNDAES